MSHISSLLSHSVAPKSEYVKNYKNVSVTRPFHASPNQTDMIAPLSPISHILETNITFVVHSCIWKQNNKIVIFFLYTVLFSVCSVA